jgi:hypothetical protein
MSVRKISARFVMLTLASIVLFVPEQARAGLSGPRRILAMGCHLVDNTCYVEISGDPAGPASCRSTSVRWNQKTDPNGQSILSLLTAAYLAGKSVDFYVNDTACYAAQPVFPTFTYIMLHQ